MSEILSPEGIKAFGDGSVSYRDTSLLSAYHVVVSRSSMILSWANSNGRERDGYKEVAAYDQAMLSRLSALQIHYIGKALIHLENSIGYDSSNVTPTRKEAETILSAGYHVFNENSDRGKAVKEIIKKTADVLGITLGGVDCLEKSETYQILASFNTTYEKANPHSR